MADEVTQRWMRNPSDEKAVAAGCRFDEERASYVVWWIERYCRLYEGFDGDPLILCGCHECPPPQHVADQWFLEDGETVNPDVLAIFTDRAKKHCECIASGHFIDWQYEAIMRTFGWVRWSEKWGRFVRRIRELLVYIAKKNKKSPTLAAIALYLLCGDGEPGQKVFLTAKDGKQAKDNAGKHTIEMLNQSPELSEECSINMVESRITHEPTRSILKPLSSSNSRTKESKEGLNGSFLVDETHVVDRDFISRINRMGISRPEPLQAEFSTVGDNPESYGKERFDRGVKVNAGEIEDQSLLAVIHAAPQDLTQEQFEADPLKYAKMSNPALGHTVDFEELMLDYQRSKDSVQKLSDFWKYRINVWQHGSKPAISRILWDAGAESFDISQFVGKRCFSALDLGFTHDTSCLVHLFPPDDGSEDQIYRMLVKFWLPEDVAKSESSQVSWLDWSARGDIVLTHGGSADFPLIRDTIVADAKKFNIVSLGYDPRFASTLCQDLKDQYQLNVVEINQSPSNFNEPCETFSKLIVDGAIKHQGNLVMGWQVGLVVFKPYGNLKMPAKPKNNSLARIDGPAAAIMAVGVMQTSDAVGDSIYETAGNLSL